jgi:metallopeptidase MepB
MYARFHGLGGTVENFGEGPNQMLENWCRIPAQLKAMSGRHYSYLSPQYFEFWKQQADGAPQPPEQIPDSVIKTDLGTLWSTSTRYSGASLT